MHIDTPDCDGNWAPKWLGKSANYSPSKPWSKGWRANTRAKLNTSTAKPALQLKFLVELETKMPTGATQTSSSQLNLEIRARFGHDRVRRRLDPSRKKSVRRLPDLCEFAGKSRLTSETSKHLCRRNYRDRGSVVPVYRREKDLAIAWRGNLRACMARQVHLLRERGATGCSVRSVRDRLHKSTPRILGKWWRRASKFPPVHADAALLDSAVSLARETATASSCSNRCRKSAWCK